MGICGVLGCGGLPGNKGAIVESGKLNLWFS